MTTEQTALLEDLRSTLRSALRDAAPGTPDPEPWKRLVSEVGVGALLVPEQQGGLGLGAHEVIAVAEEIGAAAVETPFMTHCVEATTLLNAAPVTTHRDALLKAVVDGTQRLAVVRTADALTVAITGDSVTVSGAAPAVVDSPSATTLLVAVRIGGTDAILLVDTSKAGVSVSERSALDASRSLGSVTFDTAPAIIVMQGPSATQALDTAGTWAQLALAADQLGVARRSLSETVDYVKIRTQFGAPIGSFQAVKHRCAEVLLEIELAAALIDQAARACDSANDALAAVSTAAIQSNTAALLATDSAIHLHGGIGFTWEHTAHCYYRRARANVDLLATTDELRNTVAGSVGV